MGSYQEVAAYLDGTAELSVEAFTAVLWDEPHGRSPFLVSLHEQAMAGRTLSVRQCEAAARVPVFRTANASLILTNRRIAVRFAEEAR